MKILTGVFGHFWAAGHSLSKELEKRGLESNWYTSSSRTMSVCIVAIARDEEAFIDEWICYHLHIGASRFLIYDDSPGRSLADFLWPHREYIDVVPWFGCHELLPGRNRQTKAYTDAHKRCLSKFDWIAFIDLDEYIVVNDSSLDSFLGCFPTFSAVALNWVLYGHNGFYDDPSPPITAKLLRRKHDPVDRIKSITRPEAIDSIESAHRCNLLSGHKTCDANGNPYQAKVYEGIASRAHINHYQCRSFTRWMHRVARGDPSLLDAEPSKACDLWRTDSEACLRKFVETVALDKNEQIDTHMLLFEPFLTAELKRVQSLRSAQTLVTGKRYGGDDVDALPD